MRDGARNTMRPSLLWKAAKRKLPQSPIRLNMTYGYSVPLRSKINYRMVSQKRLPTSKQPGLRFGWQPETNLRLLSVSPITS